VVTFYNPTVLTRAFSKESSISEFSINNYQISDSLNADYIGLQLDIAI